MSSRPGQAHATRRADHGAGKRLRARIRHAAFTRLPSALAGGRLQRSRSQRKLDVVDREIALPDLPDELDGLTIAHFSDMHVGELLRIDRLPRLVRRVNRLNADLIAVTGDYVDLSLDVIRPVVEAMSRLEAPLGVYHVPGNHDYLQDSDAVPACFRRAGLNMLLNEHIDITRHEQRVRVAGIDWANREDQFKSLVPRAFQRPRRHDHDASVTSDADASPAAAREDAPALRILLAHHPHAFDAAVAEGVHLTLSGHTHGGQLATRTTPLDGDAIPPRQASARGRFSMTSLSCRYQHGLYRRNGRCLHVTAGVGSWFPWRINCPAEIVRLTLRATPDPAAEPSHP